MESATGPLFDRTQRDTLRAALSRIIPASESLPSAGDLIPDAVEESVARAPTLRRTFIDGLTWLEITAWIGGDRAFANLRPDEQDGLLQRAETESPVFFELLVRQTYQGYYTHPTIVASLGLPASPQPVGYSLPPFDASLLDAVRARGPVWRRTDEASGTP